MLSGSAPLPEKLGLGGFSFDLARRNAVLEVRGMVAPKPKKTGTTIVGIVFDGGVVLGADTRATEGDTVADKNCEKIHYIADNIWCCGAGTSADTESTTGLISSQLELHRMATGKQPRVVTACTMLKRMLFRYQGNVSAALVLGGVDCKGPHLYTVYPHGSTDSLPYVTMGSGSLNAMAVFESEYKSKMTEEEAKKLARRPARRAPASPLALAPPPPLASSLPPSPPSSPLAPPSLLRFLLRLSSPPLASPTRLSLPSPTRSPPPLRPSPSSGARGHHGGHQQRPRLRRQRGHDGHRQRRQPPSAQLRPAQRTCAAQPSPSPLPSPLIPPPASPHPLRRAHTRTRTHGGSGRRTRLAQPP